MWSGGRCGVLWGGEGGGGGGGGGGAGQSSGHPNSSEPTGKRAGHLLLLLPFKALLLHLGSGPNFGVMTIGVICKYSFASNSVYLSYICVRYTRNINNQHVSKLH